MATEKKDKKKEEKKKIIFLLAGIGLIIFFFLWRFVFVGQPAFEEALPMTVRRTVPPIDFDYLESEQFKNFEEYKSIDPVNLDTIGRENPFLPY